jgi:glioma pathogenesis-related protein 2
MKLPASVLGLAMVACASGARAQSDPQTLLDAHNAYRARHCAPALIWSPELATAAQRWANRCLFDHDPNSETGENLAWGTRLSAREAVGLWYEEISQYNYSAPGFGPAGHFTQLVWRGSKQLGCGAAMCGGDVYWVCRYSPAGNYDGEYRANVAPVCR